MNHIHRFRRRLAKKQRPAYVRLELEPLEARNLLDGTPTNGLVNNPAEDTIPKQDTQSETAIVLGANSRVVVAYNDTGALAPSSNPTRLGYSLSINAGASFTDEGLFPSNGPYWALFDLGAVRSGPGAQQLGSSPDRSQTPDL